MSEPVKRQRNEPAGVRGCCGDGVGELGEAAHLEHPRAALPVERDGGIVGAPLVGRLGVEPVHTTDALADLAERADAGRPVVRATVAGDDHRRARAQRVALRVEETLERALVVAVAIGRDHPGQRDEQPWVEMHLGGFEHAGHLRHAVDEHEAAQPRELTLQRVEEQQSEMRELGDRSGDVAEHDDVGLAGTTTAQGDVHRHTASGE